MVCYLVRIDSLDCHNGDVQDVLRKALGVGGGGAGREQVEGMLEPAAGTTSAAALTPLWCLSFQELIRSYPSSEAVSI